MKNIFVPIWLTAAILLFSSISCLSGHDVRGFWIEKALQWEKESEESIYSHINTNLYCFKDDSIFIIFSGYLGKRDNTDSIGLGLTEGGSVFKGRYKIKDGKIFTKYNIYKAIKKSLKNMPKLPDITDTMHIVGLDQLKIKDAYLERISPVLDTIEYNAVFGFNEKE